MRGWSHSHLQLRQQSKFTFSYAGPLLHMEVLRHQDVDQDTDETSADIGELHFTLPEQPAHGSVP